MNRITVMAIVVIMASMWEYSNAGLNPEELKDRKGYGGRSGTPKSKEEIEDEKEYDEGTLKGCTTFEVGSSKSTSKSITIDRFFKCPKTVDNSNWIRPKWMDARWRQKFGDYGDTFSVAQNEDQVTITRTDQEAGWGLNLRIRCCPEDENEYYAGVKGGLCNQESDVIRSQEECATALKKLDHDSLNKFWITTEKSIPSGCSIHIEGRNPHFGKSTTGLGNGRSDLTPICRSSMKTKEAKTKNECISWRQTGDCDPLGPYQHDLTCDANIPSGASGYCQCKINGRNIKQGEKTCKSKTFRNCNEACNTEGPASCQDKCFADWTARDTPDCIKRDACLRACNDGTCPEYSG